MKRLLLMFAAVLGLITAGGALAGTPLGSSHPGALHTAVAPAQTTPHSPRPGSRDPRAPSHAQRATGGIAHRPVTVRRPVHTDRVAPKATAGAAGHHVSRVARSLQAATGGVAQTLRPVAARSGYLLLDPPAAAPGAAVSVQGGGFAPGALLHLSVRAPGRPALPAADAVAGPDGSFRAIITVPLTQTAPAADLVAQDAHGRGAAATLLLRTGQPLAGITPAVVTPGQRVSVGVSNFRPGEGVRVYAERLADHPILTGVAGGDGRGSWALAVPYGPGGPNQLVVVGDQGRTPVVVPYLLLNLYPHASVSSYAPQPGQRVTFYGGGFGPQESVELRLDRPDGPVLATARANAHGGLPRLGPYQIPFGMAGAHTFLLHGVDSHVLATVGLTVEPFFASVQPSTYAAGPGTVITFYGHGFAPHEIVRVYLGRTARSAGTEVAALRTTATGQLVAGSGSYVLPSGLHGSKVSFALVGDISGAAAWTSLHYMIPSAPSVFVGQTLAYRAPARQHTQTKFVSGPQLPLLVATPPRVVTGGRVSFWGGGFHPHARVHLVLTSRANPRGWALSTVRSAADGTLHTTVTIPTWVTHADAVRAYSSAGDTSARAPLEVWPALPNLVPSSYSGTAGAAYSLSGDGFTPGERVALYLDSTATPPLAVTTSTGGHIAFTGLHVPIAAAGTHTFVVKGARGEVAAVPYTELAFTPFLLLSTYSSLPERPVSVSGQDFAPHETVHLFLGDVGGRFLGDVQADATGALHATAAFTIPTSARGPLPVVAVGATSGRVIRAPLNVLPFEPSLWLSGYAGHPGATVAFTGTGFARNDTLRVYLGDAATPAATFHAHNGAFDDAGAVRIPFGTRAGMLPLTARGALSNTKVTLRYLVLAFTPGAGFEVRHRHGLTVLRLGAGGFAPHETVQLYQGTRAEGTPLRLLHADAAGNLPLMRVLAVRGTPKTSLAYTLVGVQSGAQATALYTPPRPQKARHGPAAKQVSAGG